MASTGSISTNTIQTATTPILIKTMTKMKQMKTKKGQTLLRCRREMKKRKSRRWLIQMLIRNTARLVQIHLRPIVRTRTNQRRRKETPSKKTLDKSTFKFVLYRHAQADHS